MSDVRLIQGDCLDRMADIADGSIDLVAADLPYGTTNCRWDSIIPFAPLWAHYKRIIKSRGAIVLTASQPFTSALVMSNPKWFRYEWVWQKEPSGNLNARRMPMPEHESVLVFAKDDAPYFPQGLRPTLRKRGMSDNSRTEAYGSQLRKAYTQIITGYPTSILPFAKERNRHHTTQKPVALFEYLIRTYTIEGELVLDNTMGSGTTMVACLNTNRNGIGIEKDAEIFTVAENRIAAAQRDKSELLIPA